ncbi:hypothetical protein Afil01_07530 [Actinorhabdospora filicis]|uniref:Iron-containing redox enzyme family protein n=1 Tax=Actinorhabdospora filicis TaxID=1785913 RepID=A0A9W6SI57_9ACTN|nr:iron-containing redox enzyme family protein [Actinorhabdospora filicis]GLZ75946.1 hypothetical protein Afil01_07530 [Actinorhabdospora filicis]
MSQLELYLANRSVHTAAVAERIERIERDWIVPWAADLEAEAPRFSSRADLLSGLDELLAAEERDLPESHDFVALHATREEFKAIVGQFAVDGLIESHALLPIVPRLPHRAGMAVFRVLIDEFGSGNVQRAHSQLYRDLLTELEMPTELDGYVDEAEPEVLAYVNLFHWLASRAPQPEYFLGAYAYFEASVLYAFRCYAAAVDRLDVKNSAYFHEHLYIDTFHSRQMRDALRELDADRGLDLGKVWAGITLTSAIVDAATEAAVDRARREAG